MRQYNIKEIVKERWQFYLAGYIIGYIFTLLYCGVPNYYYLIPIKMTAIMSSIGIGTALYYGKQQVEVFEGTYRSIKYILLMIGFVVVSGIMQKLFMLFGIDLTPFIGFMK